MNYGMNEDIYLKNFEGSLKAAVQHLHTELGGIRGSRPSVELIENIRVSCYDQMLGIRELGAISVIPPREIQISVWDAAAVGPVADTVLVQDLILSYRGVVDAILEAAARETALRRVLLEIKKVKRRSLALERILIPRLRSQESHIRLALEERGREEFVRLKKRKRQ